MADRIEILVDGSNPLRFTATSSSRPGQAHQVDIGAWHGNGSCTCEHFQFRILPQLQKWAGSPNPGRSTRCRHILAARRSFTDGMIARIKQALPQASEQPADRT